MRVRVRVKERRSNYWQRQLTPTPKPEARSPIRLNPVLPGSRPGKPEQLFWLWPGAARAQAKKMGRSTWLQPSITRTIYIHIR